MTWMQRNHCLVINSSKATGWVANRSQEFSESNICMYISFSVGSVTDIAISRAGSNDEWTKKVFRSRSPTGLCTPPSWFLLSLSLSGQSRVRKVARPLLLSAAVTFVGNGTSYSCYVERLRRRETRRSLSTRLGSK